MTLDRWLAGGLMMISILLFIGRCWLGKRGLTKTQLNQEQRWGGRIADFFYFVGLPYLALISGLLTVRLLGLSGLEHFSLISLAGNSGSIFAEIWRVTVLMLIEWLLDSRTIILPAFLALLIWGGLIFGLDRIHVLEIERRGSFLDGIYDGLHWAFYRAIFWLITGDLYLAVVLGAGFAMLEMGLGAYLLSGPSPLRRSNLLLRVIILILTAAVFYYSPNIWLVWLLHLAMVALINWAVSVQPQTQAAWQQGSC